MRFKNRELKPEYKQDADALLTLYNTDFETLIALSEDLLRWILFFLVCKQKHQIRLVKLKNTEYGELILDDEAGFYSLDILENDLDQLNLALSLLDSISLIIFDGFSLAVINERNEVVAQFSHPILDQIE